MQMTVWCRGSPRWVIVGAENKASENLQNEWDVRTKNLNQCVKEAVCVRERERRKEKETEMPALWRVPCNRC